VVPGVWYVMGVILSAGGAFAWYREQLARDRRGRRRRRPRGSTAEAASVPPAPTA
jgi:xylulokinase